MNAFKKNNFNTILIIVLIVLNLASLYFLAFQRTQERTKRSHKQERMRAKHPINFLKRELDLSKEQVHKFNRMQKEHFQRTREIRGNIYELRRNLFENVGNENFDLDEITDSLARYQEQLDKDTYRHFGNLRKMCDESQKRKFDDLIQKVALQIGPMPPGAKPRRKAF